MLPALILLLLFVQSDDDAPAKETTAQFARVKRIYVDVLTGGDTALQIRDLLMSSLQSSKQFIITEDEEKADATLKGAGYDAVFTNNYQSSEGINAHTQLGNGTGASSRSSKYNSAGLTIGENESQKNDERKHEARATVRLVGKNDDVIWSATAESMGAKFLGASADVADKLAKRLVADFKAAKKAGITAPDESDSDEPNEKPPAKKPE